MNLVLLHKSVQISKLAHLCANGYDGVDGGGLGQILRTVTNRHLRQKLIKLPYSVTAGDEFQTVVENLPQIPKLILDLRANMRPLSIRVGIGIGGISDKIQPPVNRLSGEAFLKARVAIDIVKKGSLYKFDVLTAFQSKDELFDETINLIYGLQDTLVRNITSKQWQTIGNWPKPRASLDL